MGIKRRIAGNRQRRVFEDNFLTFILRLEIAWIKENGHIIF